MNKLKNILFVVEGAKTEVQLLKKLLEEYNLDINYNIFIYNTNIYELYERIFETDAELEDFDLLLALKEKDPHNEVLRQKYTDIILAFDYEPQDNRFDIERINKLAEIFNESTENGKLYINYPMCEAYKHFKELPDAEFQNRVIDLECLKKHEYKKLVSHEGKYNDLRKIPRPLLNKMIYYHIKKAHYLQTKKGTFDLTNDYYDIDLKKILSIQNEFLTEVEKVYVLCTCVFFISDYNLKLLLK